MNVSKFAFVVLIFLSGNCTYAKDYQLPEKSTPGVQCQILEEAMFVFAQISPKDSNDSFSRLKLDNLKNDMLPATSKSYNELIEGLVKDQSLSTDEGVYIAVLGRGLERAIKACAETWFPNADSHLIEQCTSANLAARLAVSARKRNISQDLALETIKKSSVSNDKVAKEVVSYIYNYPATAYSDSNHIQRIMGGAKEQCMKGKMGAMN